MGREGVHVVARGRIDKEEDERKTRTEGRNGRRGKTPNGECTG